jgi:hypothetical protein
MAVTSSLRGRWPNVRSRRSTVPWPGTARWGAIETTPVIIEATNLASAQPARVKSLAATLGGYLRSVDAQVSTDMRTGRLVEWPDQVGL